MADPLQAPPMDWSTGDKVWDPRAGPAPGQPDRQGDINNILDLGVADARSNEPLSATGELALYLLTAGKGRQQTALLHVARPRIG